MNTPRRTILFIVATFLLVIFLYVPVAYSGNDLGHYSFVFDIGFRNEPKWSVVLAEAARILMVGGCVFVACGEKKR